MSRRIGSAVSSHAYDGLLLLAIWIVTGLIYSINGAAVSPLLTTVLTLKLSRSTLIAGIAMARH